MTDKKKSRQITAPLAAGYDAMLSGLLEQARHVSARAAARGEMNPVKLVVFKHESHLGNKLSGRLFKRVSITKNSELPRKIEDYSIVVDKEKLPPGITVQQWPEENLF